MLLILASEILMDSFPWYAAELFLRVCEAGGLSAASRSGKTGISQPALSAQMMTLERHLGKTLFQRKPFELTDAGRAFHEQAMRMSTRMARIREELSDLSERPLRIAASDVVIRDHLPALLRQLDADMRTQMVLQEAPSQDLAGLVRDGAADLAIGILSRYTDAGTTPLVERLTQLPLVLFVPPSHAKNVREWRDLTRLLRQEPPPGLIALPADNLLMRHITGSLRRAGIDWPTTLEISSMGHLPTYVNLDFGFGFGFVIHGSRAAKHDTLFITTPPAKMPPLTLGIWHGENPPPLATHLLVLIRQYAAKLKF